MSVVSAVRDIARLREIYVVLARHGFGEIVSRLSRRRAPGSAAPGTSDPSALAPSDIPADEAARGEDEKRRISTAERVRLVLTDLGPSFVKLGQIASTRPDVLPADVIVELKKLQDEVPPVDAADVRAAVEEALGATVAEVFERFDEVPLAAASIAQVHRATLRTPDGPREVVVKVQRPGIARTISSDVELLRRLAAMVERAIPESKIYAPAGLVDQFERAITSELDFRIEADNAQKFRRNFEATPSCKFPEVFKDASAKTVLTLEFLPGKKPLDAVAAGYSGSAIAKHALRVIVQMIFRDGFFHADPHPGNVLILGELADPVVGFIDLGMVGRLSPELRDKTVDLLIAAAQTDHLGVADALYAIGTPTRKVDMRAYRARVSELAEHYLGKPLKEIDLAGLFRDIVRGALEFGLEIPPDFLLVGKALMTVDGVGKELDPDLDVLGEARPYLVEILRERYSPERVGADLWRGLGKVSAATYDLPVQLREVLDDLRLGRLAVKTHDPATPAVVDRLGRRVFAGIVVASTLGSGTFLYAGDAHPTLGAALLVVAAAIAAGHVALDVRRGS